MLDGDGAQGAEHERVDSTVRNGVLQVQFEGVSRRGDSPPGVISPLPSRRVCRPLCKMARE
eukprot:2957750-Pleurochrysis_carterae.AAC.1